MNSWQHNIDEIRLMNTTRNYIVSGETIHDQSYSDVEIWSYEVDSKGKLINSLISNDANHYYGTNLDKCIFEFISNNKNKIELLFWDKVDIIYHAKDNGVFWME